MSDKMSKELESSIKQFSSFYKKMFDDNFSKLSKQDKRQFFEANKEKLENKFEELKSGLSGKKDIEIFEDFFYNSLYGYSKKEWLEGDPNFNIDKIIGKILFSQPFYCAFSRWITKEKIHGYKTYAAVCVDERRLRYKLIYEPRKISVLSEDEVKDIVIHEFNHIIREHITKRLCSYYHLGADMGKSVEEDKIDKDIIENVGNIGRELNEDITEDSVFRTKWNLATDLSINCWLKNMPKICLFPGEGDFKNLPPFKSADWYFNNLPQEIVDKYCQNIQFSFGHGGWKDAEKLGPYERELLERRAKQGLIDGIREASSRGWGDTSQEMRKEIMSLINPKICWKKMLKKFVGQAERLFWRSTYRKLNRRVSDYPGRSKRRIGNIAVSVDQSGSVSDELMAKFFTELEGLVKHTKITFIPFDHEVFEEYVKIWEKGSKTNPGRDLCGGTNFDAPTKYVNEHRSPRFDAHFILTDMEAPAPGPSRCPRIWITDEAGVERGHHKPSHETVIVID